MNKSIIIHKIQHGSGGIGDFIRSSLSLYSVCKRLDLQYYIDFENNPNYYECFIVQTLPKINNKYTETIGLMNLEGHSKIIHDAINKITHIPKIYYIITNALGFESNDNINNIIDDYFNHILKPSSKTVNYIQDVYNQYGINENNYISVHVRCGDAIMEKNYNANSNHHVHKLVEIDDNEFYINLDNIIKNFKKKYHIELPVIIHSDSIYFKNKLKSLNSLYIYLDVNIAHYSAQIGPNDEQSNIQTVSEFFIIANANSIIAPTYSGFSHIASIVNKKKYYCTFWHGYYDLLHCNNIQVLS